MCRTSLEKGQHRMHHPKKLHSVFIQNVLYVGAFLVATLPYLLIIILKENGASERTMFPAILFNNLLAPLQGFFNVFVFARPRYVQARSSNPENGRWWALVTALGHPFGMSEELRNTKKQSKGESSGTGKVDSTESLDVSAREGKNFQNV